MLQTLGALDNFRYSMMATFSKTKLINIGLRTFIKGLTRVDDKKVEQMYYNVC